MSNPRPTRLALVRASQCRPVFQIVLARLAQCLGRASGCWDHRHCGGARAVQILVAAIQSRLIAVAVDRCHDAALNAHRVIQNLGQWRQAVRCARSVRHHCVARNQIAVVHTIDDGFLHVFRRGRDQDRFRALANMHIRFVSVVEFACAFQNNITSRPIQFLGVIG